MAKKIRADQLVFEQGGAATLEDARRLIMAGKIRSSTDHVIHKSNEMLNPEITLIVEAPRGYVSRGAYKLKPALLKYKSDLNTCVALDIGASTGGFTDLMLQQGASTVYAVDSGTGQLHIQLREDKRVVCMEKTNARYLTKDDVPELVDIVTIDVSFISIKSVLSPLAALLKENAFLFFLIKPQFECPPADAPKGVVVNPQIHTDVLQDVQNFVSQKFTWKLREIMPAEIKGPKGNQEFIAIYQN